MNCPTTPAEWAPIAEEFKTKWNLPHACGALDGKHVAILVRQPPNTGTLFHNYKHFFSIVMMALVDPNYKFLWVDIGGDGCMSDCQIFNTSELKQSLEDGSIGFPHPDHLPNDNRDVPYFLIGDDAFPLRKYMMKPYSGRGLSRSHRIFNYIISRAYWHRDFKFYSALCSCILRMSEWFFKQLSSFTTS